MNFITSGVRQAGVVNFIYRVGETVKRLKLELDRSGLPDRSEGVAIQC